MFPVSVVVAVSSFVSTIPSGAWAPRSGSRMMPKVPLRMPVGPMGCCVREGTLMPLVVNAP